MYSAAAIVIRAIFGLVLGLFLAVAGLFLGWLTAPPGPTLPTSLLLLLSGVGAAAGGFVGWFKPEVPLTVIAILLMLVLVGGIAGSWGGWNYGQVLYPEGVYNPGASFRTPPFVVALVMASVGANVLASGFYIFRMWRHREI